MIDKQILMFLAVCAVCGLSFGLWQESLAAGVFMFIAVIALWRN